MRVPRGGNNGHTTGAVLDGRLPKGADGSVALDERWISEGLVKRDANFSAILSVESSDPLRTHQLLAYLRSRTAYRDAVLYHVTPWALRRYNAQEAQWEAVRRSTPGRHEQHAPQAPAGGLSHALQHLDEELKARPTVAVFEDIDICPTDHVERPRELLQACRAWLLDPDILLRGSLVVLVASEASRLLDAPTLERVALLRPPRATPEERRAVVRDLAQKLGAAAGSSPEQLAHIASGLNLHQLRTVLQESYHETGEFSRETLVRSKAEWVRRSGVVEVEQPDPVGFNAVGGYHRVKEFIRRNLIEPLQDPGTSERLALPLPRGLLFFGPPGTGKTVFARALAAETGLQFLNFRTENLYGPFLGQSGKQFREAIDIAEAMAPAIVFIDEIDRLGRRQQRATDGASEETRRVFGQLLEWLGDKNRRSILVGTTNAPGSLDEAFLRPGRLDYKIPFLYPDAEARRQILELHLGLTGSMPRPVLELAATPDELVETLVEATPDFTGAELEALVTRAKRVARNDRRDHVLDADFREALGRSRVDASRRAHERAQYEAQAAEFTDDAAFLVMDG